MSNPNTSINVGIRRNFAGLDAAGPGARNYEPFGGALYKSNRDALEYAGTVYTQDEEIPFDVTATSPHRYSDDALMTRYFEANMIYPES